MGNGKIQQIYKAMQTILPKHPEGMPRNALISEIRNILPDSRMGTIVAQISRKTEQHPNEFYKIRHKGSGVFYYPAQNVVNNTADQEEDNSVARTTEKYQEKYFYDSFAKYLQYDNDDDGKIHLDECSRATTVGGGDKEQGKWGTPDVVGLLAPHAKDDVQFPDEIVSAEIKTDNSSNAIITGFGQACAYRLFSHKTYLVIPESKNNNRIEKLCQLFGIGLVYFDPSQKPDISIYKDRLPAQKHSPDMFYVNDFIKGDIADRLYGRAIRKRK